MSILRKKRFHKNDVKKDTLYDINVITVSVILLCGIFAGGIATTYISSDVVDNMNAYVMRFVSSPEISEINRTLLADSAVCFFRYPVCAFLLGLTAFGVFFIPIVVFLRGFSIAFVVSTIFSTLSHKGIVVALVAYGLQAIVTVVCTIIIASKGMTTSKYIFNLMKKAKNNENSCLRSYFLLFLVFSCVLTVFSFLEVFIIPKLVFVVAKLIGL